MHIYCVEDKLHLIMCSMNVRIMQKGLLSILFLDHQDIYLPLKILHALLQATTRGLLHKLECLQCLKTVF